MSIIRINPDKFSEIFWEEVISMSIMSKKKQDEFFIFLEGLNENKIHAEYVTGSTSNVSAWLLYSLGKYFSPTNIVEIGSYIGRSFFSLLLGTQASYLNKGKIIQGYCCDMGNKIVFPKIKGLNFKQFHKKTSTQMFQDLDKIKNFKFDLIHIDGRINPEDITFLKKFSHSKSIYVLDDFEQTEKGVINYNILIQEEVVDRNKYMIAPPPAKLFLKDYNLFGRTKTACLIPFSYILFTRQ